MNETLELQNQKSVLDIPLSSHPSILAIAISNCFGKKETRKNENIHLLHGKSLFSLSFEKWLLFAICNEPFIIFRISIC